MNYQHIRYEVSDGIATITLNRPDQLNAFTKLMMQEMITAFDEIDKDDEVRAVIVTGSGEGFCAGADLSAGAEMFVIESTEDGEPIVLPDGSLNYGAEGARDGGGRLTLRIFECLKPVIAAINGPAVGIGVTMTLPMDIRLVSDSARIGFVFSRRGIVPEAASSWFLPRIVGIQRALLWTYSGRIFSAREALEGGLVQSIHRAEDLQEEARILARGFADQTAPVSIALIRQMMWRGLGMAHPMEAHKIDSRGILSRGRSTDVAEGVSSFLEKRPARFCNQVSTDMPDYFPWWENPRFE